MRTLSTYNDTETSRTITEPFYLVQLDFSVTLYLCSLKTITISSIVWDGGRKIKVPKINTDTSGTQKGAVQLSDIDNLISGLILSEGCADKAAIIYQGYGAPASDSEIIKIFEGVMDSSSIDDRSVTINLLGENSVRYSPNVYISPPDFNYLPPAGTIIKTGNTTITLEPSVY